MTNKHKQTDSGYLDYIKNNWLLILFCLIFINGLIQLILQPGNWVSLILAIMLCAIGSFLSRNVFLLQKSGPLPWYGSPILWGGLVVVCGLLYFLAYVVN